MKILFHYPGPLHAELDSGEKVRPVRMLEAFRGLGHEVEVIAGTYEDRSEAIRRMTHQLGKFAFLYAESSSLPLRLANARRMPHWPCADAELFQLAHRVGLRSGVFLRDIYWMYRSFTCEVGVIKHALSIPFYLDELRLYRNTIDTLFVPSAGFRDQLSGTLAQRAIPLPPGCQVRARECAGFSSDDPLRLIYVGSVAPPIYDMRDIAAIVARATDLHLTIVTREADWARHGPRYPTGTAINVVHASGEALSRHYADADLCLLCFQDSPYRRICMPLKLFEALGHGVPVMTYPGTAVADFVNETGAGWVVERGQESSFLRDLHQHRELLSEKRRHLATIQPRHTWRARAEQVVATLTLQT